MKPGDIVLDVLRSVEPRPAILLTAFVTDDGRCYLHHYVLCADACWWAREDEDHVIELSWDVV